jgi:pimeloyl-ACP methyl ester carboxylesterase
VSAVRAIRDRADSTDVVTGLAAPLLVVVGDRDPIAPVEYARELAAAAPQGKAVILEETGHLPSLEQPDRFNAELLELVDGLA